MTFYLSSGTKKRNWSHSPQLAWISVQLLFFLFLSLVSSPSWTTADPVPTNEHPNTPTKSVTNSPPAFPTANELIKNTISISAVYPESEYEPLPSTNTSRQNVRPFASRPGILALRITLNLWLLTKNTYLSILPPGPKLLKSLDSMFFCFTSSNQSSAHGKSHIGIALDKNLQSEPVL